MSFALLFLIVFLIFLSFRKYRSLASVFLSAMLMLCMTTGVLLYGLRIFRGTELWHVFGKDINAEVFISLIAIWYVFDAICGIIIIRKYVEYRKVNSASFRGK